MGAFMDFASTRDSSRSSLSLSSLIGDRSRVIAIVSVESVDNAEPLLDALESGGIGVIEVTLRTPNALKVIAAMSRCANKAIVGAGTLTRPEQFAQARDAGAKFLVSPALSPALAHAAKEVDLPFLPGTTTPTEVLLARELGFYELKCFPSDLNGGVRWLQHVQPLFSDVTFCPTGGVSNTNALEYLSQANVFAVGGGYMALRSQIESQKWAEIKVGSEEAVRTAAQ